MATKQRSPMWSGFIAFAAMMMIIVGVINILEGVVTIVERDRTVVVANQLYVVDLLAWGILTLAFGVLVTVAGVGVLSGRGWARIVAIVCVALHAIVQVASLVAYPLWSLLMLALDVAILYALTAAWHEASAPRGRPAMPDPRDPRDDQAIWEQHPRTMA